MMALPPEKLKILRYDIPTASTAIIGAISKLLELADDIQATFKNVDPQLIPNLKQQAKAMAMAYVLNQAASKPSLSVTELSARIVAIRADLESDARNAARRGLIDPERLKELQGIVGYKNQAFDTLLLSALLRAAWPRLEGKTFVTLAEIDEANVLAYQLLQAVGEKEQLTPASQEAADILLRAIALFEGTYYEVDRLVQRREGRVSCARSGRRSGAVQPRVGRGRGHHGARQQHRARHARRRPVHPHRHRRQEVVAPLGNSRT